MKLIC
jgi:DNA-directed RNA polymerase subunit RPC12/RpoP